MAPGNFHFRRVVRGAAHHLGKAVPESSQESEGSRLPQPAVLTAPPSKSGPWEAVATTRAFTWMRPSDMFRVSNQRVSAITFDRPLLPGWKRQTFATLPPRALLPPQPKPRVPSLPSGESLHPRIFRNKPVSKWKCPQPVAWGDKARTPQASVNEGPDH